MSTLVVVEYPVAEVGPWVEVRLTGVGVTARPDRQYTTEQLSDVVVDMADSIVRDCRYDESRPDRGGGNYIVVLAQVSRMAMPPSRVMRAG
jgi:hypothetical protein